MLEASRRRRQRRTWKHGAIKYMALAAIMVVLCLFYVKQSPASFEHTDSSLSSFTHAATFRSTFDDNGGAPEDSGDDGGGCDRYAVKPEKKRTKAPRRVTQFHLSFLLPTD